MRLFVAVVVVFFLFGCSANDSTEETSVDLSELTKFDEEKYFDAYVLSKSSDSFFVVEDLENKSSKIRVSMANNEDKSVIQSLKKKQPVRIWHDFIRESYPAKTTAYRVEVLEE